jgi:hypothetical protein
MTGSEASCDALDQDSGVGSYEDGHEKSSKVKS